MKKVLKKLGGILLVFVAILVWAVYSYEQDSAHILTSSNVVSGAKIGWGVKRAENHERPDLRKD